MNEGGEKNIWLDVSNPHHQINDESMAQRDKRQDQARIKSTMQSRMREMKNTSSMEKIILW